MRPPPAPIAAGGRRKATPSREWLVVCPTGGFRLEEAGKHSIMARTGLPARDLRVLDPLLSYPSSILGRERAIVVNLEHIKAIITATEVLIPNAKGPSVVGFVRDLCARVAPDAMPAEFDDADVEAAVTTRSPCAASPFDKSVRRDGSDTGKKTDNSSGSHQSNMSALDTVRDGARVLPFEFRALEVCLESTCRCLETETSTLDKEAYPALDELTSKISSLNLERVRQIKSRLVAISGRVQKVRDELEHLLDDDMDMAEMYLTEKLNQQRMSETGSRVEGGNPQVEDNVDEDYRSEADRSSVSSVWFKPNVEELEMLLEAYFVQIDGTLNKLSHLREYVDDTEDYINIMLDDKQNQLLQMGVMLSTATVVITAGVAVVGVFGMNINIGLYNDPPDPNSFGANSRFLATSLGTLVGCFVLYILAIGFGKKSGLLQ